MPPANHVVSGHLFEFLTEVEIQKALRLQYPISLVTLALTRKGGEPTERKRQLLDEIAPMISQKLRSTDTLARHPSLPRLRILLVDASLEDVGVVVDRITDDLQPMFTLRFGAACFPASANSLAELLLLSDPDAGRIC